MINLLKRPMVIISAGALLILLACLIPLLKTDRWDNLLLGGTYVIGITIVCLLFTVAIQRAKARV